MRAGLFTLEVGREAERQGLDDRKLGALYGTSVESRTDFAASVRAEIDSRRAGLAALDPRPHEDAARDREARDAMRTLVRDSQPVPPERLSALMRHLESPLASPAAEQWVGHGVSHGRGGLGRKRT